MHIKDINRAISMAEKSNLFDNLNRMYDGLPEGQCGGCTACCRESVPTFFIEYINIVNYLKKDQHLFEKLWPKFMDFYFTELTEKKGCPFLDENDRCSIYPVRPLPCRLFGFSSYDEYEANLRAVEKGNREVKKYYKNAFGLVLPDAVVEYKVPFCTDFIPERTIDTDERLDYSDVLFGLDSRFLMSGILDPEMINMTLIHWFAFMAYDEDDAGDLRIQISQEILENGSSKTLRKLLKNNAPKI